MAKLTTEFKRIGRSGPTVDGRMIEPIAIEQAAASYDKKLFTAMIWPDHIRWLPNMGIVEELKAEANDEGGMDLYARIAPNDRYIYENKNGQYLFTSMELLPNFRDTGEYYLTGLAATDNPASAATTEMRFSALSAKDAILGAYVENQPHQFQDDQPPGWFTKFFKNKNQNQNQPDEDVMSQQALAALAERFTAMEARMDALTPDNNAGKDTPSTDYADLKKKVQKLTSKLESANAEGKQGRKKFKKLSADYKKLRKEFNAAVGQENGTTAGENDGDAFNADDYI